MGPSTDTRQGGRVFGAQPGREVRQFTEGLRVGPTGPTRRRGDGEESEGGEDGEEKEEVEDEKEDEVGEVARGGRVEATVLSEVAIQKVEAIALVAEASQEPVSTKSKYWRMRTWKRGGGRRAGRYVGPRDGDKMEERKDEN